VNQQLQKLRDLLPGLIAKCGESIVITIDGPAGSGKTTLAKELSASLDSCYTIHMDDLYEGWDSTLTSGLTRKLTAIYSGVQRENRIRYAPFNWLESKLDSRVDASAPKYLIIEGVGSGQSATRDFISLALWIEVSPGLGLERVIKRDGPGVAQFMPAFIVAQNSHFEKEATKKSADYRLSGQDTV
jgi:Ni2+-binding GTPase involved in maturation of urease and hydrogenase